MRAIALARVVTGVMVGLALVAGTGRAQGPPPPMGGMQSGLTINLKKFETSRELTRLTKRYKLTEDERAKIKPLLEEQESKIHTMSDDQSMNDTDWVAAVRKTHRATVMSIKALMTDAQAGKYVADEEKQAKDDMEQDQMPSGPPPGGGGPPPGGGGGPPGA